MIVALVVAACGGGNDNTATPKQTAAPHAKAGGDLQFLYSGDVDNIDPGITYYTGGYLIVYATQRPLVNYKPSDPTHPVPDLAAALPEVSRGQQDGDREAPHGREVLAARQSRGHVGGREVRDRAGVLQDRQQRLRGRVLRRHRRREDRRRARDRDQGHRDARSADRRVQARAAVGRRAGRRADDADRRAGAARLRAAVRHEVAFDVRHAPGRDRAVHDPERRPGQHDRLPRGQRDQADPQPELGPRDRLQARLPRLDRRARGQQGHDRRVAPGAVRQPHGQRRVPRAGSR